MIELVRTTWHGKPQYAFEHGDGSRPNGPRRDARPGDARAAVTEAQAALGLTICAALFETGRL